MFAGIALYISVVESPARLRLSPPQALAQWKTSYTRAAPLQAALAAASAASGVAHFFYESADQRAFLPALLIGSVIPVTFAFIMPLNRRLLATKHEDANDRTVQQLESWAHLHHTRTGLGLLAAAAFVWLALGY